MTDIALLERVLASSQTLLARYDARLTQLHAGDTPEQHVYEGRRPGEHPNPTIRRMEAERADCKRSIRRERAALRAAQHERHLRLAAISESNRDEQLNRIEAMLIEVLNRLDRGAT